MTYAVSHRLDYIDWRLTVHGSVGRQDLVETFGVSPSQASHDLTAYETEHPGVLVYNLSAKHYIRAPRYGSQRGWTPAAVKAMAQLAQHHASGWK